MDSFSKALKTFFATGAYLKIKNLSFRAKVTRDFK